MKSIVYYSNFNLDSCLAAMMNVSLFNTLKDVDVEAIAYDRTVKFTPPKDVNVISIVGVELSPFHIESLIDKNPTANIYLFDTSGYVFNRKHSNVINDKLIIVNDEVDEETGEPIYKELSPLMYNYIHNSTEFKDSNIVFNDIFPNINDTDFKELMGSLICYNNFELMTKEEIYYVHKNIENIMNVLENTSSFKLDKIESIAGTKAYEPIYTKHVSNVRNLINRNFQIKYLTSGINFLHVPVLNISHEVAFAAMRLISYSYDDIVVYEDTADGRIYRIYTKRNKEWYIKCMKPNDVWMEGNITFMRCNVPVHEIK